MQIDLEILKSALGDLALQNVMLQSQQKALQIELAKAEAALATAQAVPDVAKAA